MMIRTNTQSSPYRLQNTHSSVNRGVSLTAARYKQMSENAKQWSRFGVLVWTGAAVAALAFLATADWSGDQFSSD